MNDLDSAWPVIVLALRISTVVVLYLFLFSAFRALRGQLRAADTLQAPALLEHETREAPGGLEEREAVEPAGPEDRSRRAVRPRVAIPAAAVVMVLVLGGLALFAARPPAGDAPSEAASSQSEFGPPIVTPAPGRVTVGLAATEDSQVRVTVDGVVQFEGTLRARERQLWEGSERIQVWTSNGRTLQLSVNGENLGAYSPAMGHPEWNRIDFGFWPGWTRQGA